MLTKLEIEKKIADLEAARDQFIKQAEYTVAELAGRIAALKELVAEPKPEIHAVEPFKDEAQA